MAPNLIGSIVRKKRGNTFDGRHIADPCYTVERLLGEGASARVYEALPIGRGVPVALKIMRSEQELGKEMYTLLKGLFANEVDVLSLLHASGDEQAVPGSIVRYIDANLSSREPWVALELLKGSSLETVMAERKLTPYESVYVARQVARAIERQEEVGVVNRDIKPSNIMIAQGGRALVTDYGAAVQPSKIDKDTMEFVGTPLYLAPEAMNMDKLSPQLDVYGLGLVLYEMLTGQVAMAENPDWFAMLFDRCQKSGYVSPSRAAVIPAERVERAALDSLVDGMLEPKPENRPRPREVRERLQKLPSQHVYISTPQIPQAPGLVTRFLQLFRMA